MRDSSRVEHILHAISKFEVPLKEFNCFVFQK